MGYGLWAMGSLLAFPLTAHRLPPTVPLTAHRSPLTVEPGSELTVTLLTYETGGRVWERFGHNALWIHNAQTGADDHYDYGRFSFERPHFVLRFLQGKLWYSMGYESNVPGMIEAYSRQGRKLWAQELELTAAQRLALRDFLEWNWKPENREYFYDYYRDNCSTRIRDAIDRVIGGAIRRYGAQPSAMTWRDETRRLNENNAPLYTGLLLALGQPVDVTMSRWDQMFLPGRLREHLDSITVPGPAGTARPLVKTERVLNPGGRWPVPDRPSSWVLRYAIFGVLVGVLLAGLGRTRAFMPLATLWALLVGLAGALLSYLWFLSDHAAASRNENLLLFNVLALALAVLLPSATRGKQWAIAPARRLALLIAGLGALALLLKPLPWFSQHNLEVIALALPIHLGLWLGLEKSPRRENARTLEG
jgi:uncharacterized protein DUF4105